jgi:hypothetical protein
VSRPVKRVIGHCIGCIEGPAEKAERRAVFDHYTEGIVLSVFVYAAPSGLLYPRFLVRIVGGRRWPGVKFVGMGIVEKISPVVRLTTV